MTIEQSSAGGAPGDGLPSCGPSDVGGAHHACAIRQRTREEGDVKPLRHRRNNPLMLDGAPEHQVTPNSREWLRFKPELPYRMARDAMCDQFRQVVDFARAQPLHPESREAQALAKLPPNMAGRHGCPSTWRRSQPSAVVWPTSAGGGQRAADSWRCGDARYSADLWR